MGDEFAHFIVVSPNFYYQLLKSLGDADLEKHKHALLNYLLITIIKHLKLASKINALISNFCRLGQVSCLGCACQAGKIKGFPFYRKMLGT